MICFIKDAFSPSRCPESSLVTNNRLMCPCVWLRGTETNLCVQTWLVISHLSWNRNTLSCSVCVCVKVIVFSHTPSLLIDPSPSIKASVLNHAKLISRSNIARLGTLACWLWLGDQSMLVHVVIWVATGTQTVCLIPHWTKLATIKFSLIAHVHCYWIWLAFIWLI